MPDVKFCNILPRSLERLMVGCSDSPIEEEHLKELILARDERFPRLKKIEVKWRGIKDPGGLKRDYNTKGVDLLLWE
ncbi:uncharacterized protein K444DRAFT_612858 [Hyaloscypha bicolor E]|uniref:Uncharacterized protein n=1 Tax=Hyaloscypha bicolor E TaxID=1095630 RepID=A0A2J6TBC3_9HELO|nr:uncharacterized protein K444DRAFT_612858 [Hyaloscypha bicolor E]PMD60283.1 hypothetical protein K444DRAFT_612858 [Hyaloscypha bicolor E]